MYKRFLHPLHKWGCPSKDIKYEKILNLINHQGNKIKIVREHHSRLTGIGWTQNPIHQVRDAESSQHRWEYIHIAITLGKHWEVPNDSRNRHTMGPWHPHPKCIQKGILCVMQSRNSFCSFCTAVAQYLMLPASGRTCLFWLIVPDDSTGGHLSPYFWS